jgi:hypothetical protein
MSHLRRKHSLEAMACVFHHLMAKFPNFPLRNPLIYAVDERVEEMDSMRDLDWSWDWNWS